MAHHRGNLSTSSYGGRTPTLPRIAIAAMLTSVLIAMGGCQVLHRGDGPALSARDLEIIGFVLGRKFERYPLDRIDFLTLTPRGHPWRPQDPPPSVMALAAQLPVRLRSASEAAFKDGFVVARDTHEHGWMHWITIEEWVSDHEVRVHMGSWSGPLGGGGTTTTYEKVDGEWRIKKLGPMWVS